MLRTGSLPLARSERWARIEAVAVNAALLAAYVLVLVVSSEGFLLQLAALLLTYAVLFGPGALLAFRLPPARLRRGELARQLGRNSTWFGGAILATDLVAYLFLHGPTLESAMFGLEIAGCSILAFLFSRTYLEAISIAGTRPRHRPRETRFSRLAIRSQLLATPLLGLALLLWAAIILGTDATANDYVPEIYREAAGRLGLSLPGEIVADRLPVAGLPAVFALFLGLLVGKHSRNLAATLFAALCLLTGLFALDIYPGPLGEVIWNLHLLAWFLIPPVALHLALFFPRPEDRWSAEHHSVIRGLIPWLYGVHLVPALVLLWLLNDTATLLTVFDTRVFLAPLVIPAALVAGLGVPLAWIVGGIVLWRGYRAAGVDVSQPDDSGGVARLRRQLLWALIGAVVVVTVFSLWLMLLGLGLGTTYAEFMHVAGKYTLTGYFCLIAAAIWRQRLWLSRAVVNAFFWAGLVLVIRGLANLFSSWVANVSILIFGIVTYGLLAWLTNTAFIERHLYRWFRRKKWDWHRKVETTVAGLRSPARGKRDHETLAAEIVPPDCPGAWLAAPVRHSSPPCFDLRKISSTVPTRLKSDAPVISGLFQRLGSEGNRVELKPPFLATLQESSKELEIFLPLQSLEERIKYGTKLPVWLKRTWFRHDDPRLVPQQLSDDQLEQLVEARIALVIPFGGDGRLSGVLILGAESIDDHYDRQDLRWLRHFASHASVAMVSADCEPWVSDAPPVP